MAGPVDISPGIRETVVKFCWLLLIAVSACPLTAQVSPAEQKDSKKQEPDKPVDGANRRIELNLLGKTDSGSGESRRNENIPFNLVDNNALKELNVRLGTTATIVREFRPANGYFGAEFGNSPVAALAVPPGLRRNFHGNAYAGHLNSVTSARSFFQVGSVKPAHENEYGLTLGFPIGRGTRLLLDGGQHKLRGSVNGNVLVPKADERTPLTSDPVMRAIVSRFLAAYPTQVPNRTDVNPRSLNTNAPQVIDNDNAHLRMDKDLGARDLLVLDYSFVSQAVDAFQFVAGQNPDTDTRAHKARILWTRNWSSTTVSDISLAFDRVRSYLRPEPNAVGPMVSIAGLETLGPQGSIPIDRAQNLFRYASQMRRISNRHSLHAGLAVTRRQFNGVESDTHRGFFSFANDFGRTGITNLRLGTPSQYIISVGDVRRGFRNWDLAFFAGDTWRIHDRLTVDYGLRYQPTSRPNEVNDLNTIAYDCDCNNLGPQFGLAYKMPGRSGVIRAAFGVHYGEIFPVTFSQVRFSPPGSVKLVVMTPSLINPMGFLTQSGDAPKVLGNLYLLDPELSNPYSYQYNASWEPDWSANWKLQLGYVGSRSHKLFTMWYLNRAHAVPGTPQTTATINQRRPNPDYAEIRWVLNGSRGYFDAARASFVMPPWRRVSMDASYWFSKALDLGSSYTNTAADADTRISRSQSEYETHRDMKGPSSFDQTHAFLWRWSYEFPWAGSGRLGRIAGGWNLSAVVLVKSGTPFTVLSGSDAPGFGNVDGNGNDRPNLVDISVLGRTFGDPDTSRLLLPRSAFVTIAPTVEQGNLGRNTFRKGAIRNLNAALSRSWAVRHDLRVTFRAESVNLFNTPQFAEPGFEYANQNFGQITNTLNEGRTLRFHANLSW